MSAAKLGRERNASMITYQRESGSSVQENSGSDSPAFTDGAQPICADDQTVTPRSTSQRLGAFSSDQAIPAIHAPDALAATDGFPSPPAAASAPTRLVPPAAPTTPRRDSKAARALQHLSAACRRISEVGLSAVTSAAASWVLPSASRRRPSAPWPPDPEAALSPTSSNTNSSTLGSAGSPSMTPRKLSTQPRVPPGARRFGSASHSIPPGADLPPLGSGSPLYGSPLTSQRLPPAAAGGRGATRSCTGPLGSAASAPLTLLPPPSLPPAAIASAPLSPPYRPGTFGQQTGGGGGGPGAVGAGGGDGFFKPRATPADGLLFLAPGARTSMWSPQRGTRWSLQQYELHRRLYRGYASTVYKATCITSNSEVVLKVYSLATLTDFLRHQVLRELDIHSRLRHPGIVQLLAAFREGDTLVMVLELVRGGSLDQARKRLGGRMGEQWALHLVVLPLLRVLSHLHRLGVVHRDIKPENILFTPDWRIKLCDFGVSIYLAEERAVTRAGSSDYMAPEVNACPLKRTPADNKVNEQLAYGAACDVWSLGAVVYELLVGFTPFPGGPPPSLGVAAQRVRTASEGTERRAGAAVEGSTTQGATEEAAAAKAAAGPTAVTVVRGAHEEEAAGVEISEAAEQDHEQEEQYRVPAGTEAAIRGAAEATAGAEAARLTARENAAAHSSLAPAAPAIGTQGAPTPAPPPAAAEPEASPSPSATVAQAPAPVVSPLMQRSLSSTCSPSSSPSCSPSSSDHASSPSSSPASCPLTSLAFPARLSPPGRSFLLACLEAHAGDRPTTEELLQHPWVLGAQQTPLAESVTAPPCAEES